MERYCQGKNEELAEKPVPALPCPPQIPHALVWNQTRASMMTAKMHNDTETEEKHSSSVARDTVHEVRH